MIQVSALLTILKAVPWRSLGALGAAVSLALLGYRVALWHDAYGRVEALEQALESEQECGPGSHCRAAVELAQREVEELARVASREVVNAYEEELGLLRRSRTVRPVRVCPDPAAGNLHNAPATGRAGSGTAAAGLVQPDAGRDLGPELYALALEADQLSARCRALISWQRALRPQGVAATQGEHSDR